MKLTIFAATGRIGRHLLRQALDARHEVTAVVRDPAKLTGILPPGAEVRTVTADLLAPDPELLRSAVGGADAVLSCFGPSGARDAGHTTEGTRPITDAMQATGVRRIVVVSASPVSTTPSPGRPHPPRHDPGEGPLIRWVGKPLGRLVYGRHFADLARMEDLLRESGLEWTAVRPPRLTDRPPTHDYRTALNQNLRGGALVSRADVAHCMLRVLDDPATVKQAVGIAD
jgi:putative NADH-flavin reductase